MCIYTHIYIYICVLRPREKQRERDFNYYAYYFFHAYIPQVIGTQKIRGKQNQSVSEKCRREEETERNVRGTWYREKRRGRQQQKTKKRKKTISGRQLHHNAPGSCSVLESLHQFLHTTQITHNCHITEAGDDHHAIPKKGWYCEPDSCKKKRFEPRNTDLSRPRTFSSKYAARGLQGLLPNVWEAAQPGADVLHAHLHKRNWSRMNIATPAALATAAAAAAAAALTRDMAAAAMRVAMVAISVACGGLASGRRRPRSAIVGAGGRDVPGGGGGGGGEGGGGIGGGATTPVTGPQAGQGL